MKTAGNHLVLLAALALAACGDSSAPPSGGSPTIEIITEPSGTAVINERYATPLKLLIRDSEGRRAPGVRVRFNSGGNDTPFLYWSQLDSTNLGYNSDTTGADGTMTVIVWAGSKAGRALGVVRVSDLELADTVALEVTPGIPAQVRALSGDTALRVGGTGMLRAEVLDSYYNHLPDPATFASATPAVVAVSVAGEVTGLAIGLGKIITSYGSFADTIAVSVVPPGRLAAVREWENTGQTEEIVMLDTDGGNLRDLRSCLFFYNRRIAISWQPGFDRLIFADAASCGTGPVTLFRINDAGVTTTLLTSASLAGDAFEWPSYSADGSTIYFTRIVPSSTGARDAWKTLADGSSPSVAIPPDPSGYARDVQLASSPDGSKIAFATNRLDLDPFDHKLAIFTIGTGNIALFSISAEGPRWSPDGSQIAFVAGGAVKLVAPDGTGLRTLAAGPGFTAGLDWSPDGEWIVAGGQGGLVLINVESGLALPLNFDTRLRGPRWKPS